MSEFHGEKIVEMDAFERQRANRASSVDHRTREQPDAGQACNDCEWAEQINDVNGAGQANAKSSIHHGSGGCFQ